ncbi:MAG TPA: SGNH/GDSL hydrolase family protein [Desulfobaccales bacterium]|nr:SGNH/GDSL hydrolase family protein [Desulfobaccales bacterium]
MSSNWFNKNPIKTLVITVLVMLVLITYGAEKILQYKNQGIGFHFNLPHRVIMLREYRPLMNEWFEAGRQDEHYDTLVAKKYLMRIDADGFIEPSKKYTNPDMSLVFIGGSTTECRYVDEEHRFPYLVGALLEQQAGIKINSYNAARSGNHSLNSLDILLNKVFPIKPDIVVMLENINDLTILLYESSYWNRDSSRSVIFDINKEMDANFIKLIRDRYIPNLAMAMRNFDSSLRLLWKPKKKSRDEFAQIRGKHVVYDESAMVEQFEMNLQSFIYLCKARNIIPVIMTMPSRFKEKPDKIILDAFNNPPLDYFQFKQIFDLFNKSILKKAQENNIMVIDLAKEIPQENEFMYDIVHYTDKGARKVADIISGRLQPVVSTRIKQRSLQVH